MNMENWNPNLTITSAFVFYIVWSYRQGTWPLFFEALAGTKVIDGTRVSSTTGTVTPPASKSSKKGPSLSPSGKVLNPAKNFYF